MFGAHDVFGNGIAVVRLDELLCWTVSSRKRRAWAFAFAAGDLGFVLDVLAHEAADVFAFLGVQPVFGVDGIEMLLDEREADVARAAGAVRRDAAQAGVVLVVVAVAAVAVALAAGTADELAGHVVVVLAAAAAAGAVAIQNVLGAVEGVAVDDRFVAAGEFVAPCVTMPR